MVFTSICNPPPLSFLGENDRYLGFYFFFTKHWVIEVGR